MPAAWDIGDLILKMMLDAMKTQWGDEFGKVRLFQNDYTPVPGMAYSSFVECDFPGYEEKFMEWASFGFATAAGHVASILNSETLAFQADSGGFSEQSVFGYYVVWEDDNVLWAERFPSVITMVPNGEVRITPRLLNRTYPNP